MKILGGDGETNILGGVHSRQEETASKQVSLLRRRGNLAWE